MDRRKLFGMLGSVIAGTAVAGFGLPSLAKADNLNPELLRALNQKVMNVINAKGINMIDDYTFEPFSIKLINPVSRPVKKYFKKINEKGPPIEILSSQIWDDNKYVTTI